MRLPGYDRQERMTPMRHVTAITRTPAAAVTGTTPLAIKLNGIIQILDRLALAQLQGPWKAPFPTGGSNDTSNSSSNSSSLLSTL